MKKHARILLMVFIVFWLGSLGPAKSQVSENGSISKVIIQIFPVFYTHSQIVLDVKNNDMVFDMIGDVRFIKVDGNYDMPPFFYKFDTDESIFLNDSILSILNIEDFSDSYLDMNDGIGIDILYVFSDGNTKKIELVNNSTLNQSKLLSFLFESMIKNCTDSTTIKYSQMINKQY